MKVRLNDKHSPCQMCFIRGVYYDPNSKHCQGCEYHIAIKLLQKTLEESEGCSLCKNGVKLGGGYWSCIIPENEYGCSDGQDYVIDWEAACKAYDLELVED